jgi:hypothetical protein
MPVSYCKYISVTTADIPTAVLVTGSNGVTADLISATKSNLVFVFNDDLSDACVINTYH